MRSKSVVWVPVLMVGAMVYWTLAFGFGGMSLMAFSLFQESADSDDDAAAVVKDSYQSITVNLSDLGATPSAAKASEQGGPDVEGSSVTVDLVSDHDLSRPEPGGQGAHGGGPIPYQGPGQTAF